MLKYILLIALFNTGLIQAQVQTLGPSSAAQGQTVNYIYITQSAVFMPTWIVTNGAQVVSTGNDAEGYWADITFVNAGSTTVTFKNKFGVLGQRIVTVEAPPATPSNPTVSSNACGTKTLTRGTPPTGVTWYWQTSASGVSTSNSNTTYPVSSSQTVWLRARSTGGVWSTNSASANVTIIPNATAGSITISGAQQKCASASLTISSAGSPGGGNGTFTYQWQQSPNGTSSWTNAPGDAIKPFYISSATTTTWYRRAETSVCGTLYSNTVMVFVYSALNAGTISGSQSRCSGETASAFVSSSPADDGFTENYSYQWQRSLNQSAWTNIAGATNATYSPGSHTQTTYYRRSVTTVCETAYSNVLTVTVVPFNAGTITGASTICTGMTPGVLSSTGAASAASCSFTYRWEQSPNGTTWVNATGTNTNASYQPPTLTSSTYYRRAAIFAAATVYTSSMLITVAALNPGTISGASTVCPNATPGSLGSTAAASAAGCSFTYQWQQSANGTTWVTAAGINTNASYQPPALTSSTYYRRSAIFSTGTVYTSSVLVSVITTTAGSINPPVPQQKCASASITISSASSPSGGNGTFTYQWQQSPNGTSSWTTAPGENYKPFYISTATTTTWYRRAETSVCGTLYSNSVMVFVYSALNPGTVSGSQSRCSGETASAFISSSAADDGFTENYTYQWQSSVNQSTWTNISGATNETYSPGSHTQTTYYRRSVTTVCETAYSNVLTVTVVPFNPGTIAGASSICSGAIPGVINSTQVASAASCAFTYQWQQSPNGTTNWVAATGTNTNATYQPPGLTSSTYYRRAAVFSASTVYTSSVLIAVTNPNPGTVIAQAEVLYSSGSANLNAISFTGSIIRWERRVPNGSWSTISGSAGLTAISETLTTTYQYRIVVQDGGCVKYSEEKTVQVAQFDFAGSISGTSTVTGSANNGTLELTGHTGSVAEWQTSDYGAMWTTIAHTGSTYTFTNLTQPAWYRVKLIKGGSYEFTQPHFVNWQPEATEDLLLKNYKLEQVIRQEETNPDNLAALTPSQQTTAYSYFDGFGRTAQTVVKAASPTLKDIVSFQDFSITNQPKAYLPFAATGNNFYTGAAALQGAFYLAANDQVANDAMPYSQTVLEGSPLDRVLEQGAPGADFQPGTGHTVSNHWRSNIVNEIRIWKPDATSPGYYAAGTLYVYELSDQNGNLVKTFTDKAGRTIEKHVQSATSTWLKTLHIYDEMGRVKYTLQPELLVQVGSLTTISPSLLNELAFQYTYDVRNRMTEYKAPGAASVYYCYDRFDRLVLMQDGNMRIANKWMYVKYDRLNRPVMQGIYTNTTYLTRTAIQTNVVDPLYASGVWYEERQAGTEHGYSNQSFPTSDAEVWAVQYYDNHDFDRNETADYVYTTQGLAGEKTPGTSNSRVTGGKRRVIDTNNWLYTYVFYDVYGRPIQVRSNNHLNAVVDNLATTVYDFEGKVTVTKNYHNAGGSNQVTVINKYEYDAKGRLAKVFQNNNNAPVDQLVALYKYNELGQLVDKKLHNTSGENFLQSVDYRYNLHGQLSSINNSQLTNDTQLNDDSNDYFGMELLYNTVESGLGNAPSYNGNISAMKWKGAAATAGVTDQKSYKYNYDKSDRLLTATFQMRGASTWNVNAGMQNESMTYDANGNIKTLQRYHNNESVAQLMDNLSYTYNSGNTLGKVTDAAPAAVAAKGFDNGTSGASNDYTYDVNGNLTADLNKGISSIDYNFLGKPSQVTFSDGRVIVYTYDAAGTKLKMAVTQGENTNTTDYVGSFVYENSNLKFFGSSEGRVVKNGSSYEYQYAIADHQGNTRVVFSSVTPAPDDPVATIETANETDERAKFLKYDDVRKVNAVLFDHTNSGATNYSVRLSGSASETYGLARSLAVAPGDKVKAEVYAKYVDPNSSNWTTALNNLMSAITSGSSGTVIDGANYGTPSGSTIPFVGDLSHNGETGTAPKAYLNWLVFDNQYNLILSKTGFRRLSETPKENGSDVPHEKLEMPEINITEPGYVYIYLSNENGTPIEVYFDDFQVTHTKTNIIQYSEYYPFGLQTASSWTRENATENNYLYNAANELNKTTGWYEMFFRGYDPAIGRMLQIDPYAAMFASESVYSYSGSNPIMFNDPSGGRKNQRRAPEPPPLPDEGARRGGGGGGMNSQMAMASMGFSDGFTGGVGGGPGYGRTDFLGMSAAAEQVRSGQMSPQEYAATYGGFTINGPTAGGIINALQNGGSATLGGGTVETLYLYKGSMVAVDGNGNPTGNGDAVGTNVFYYNQVDLEVVMQENFNLSDAQQRDPDPWSTTKAAAGIAVITSAADGPIPVGEIVGAVIIIGAVAWDLVKPEPIVYARIPKNRLPEQGPPNGKLERRNQDTGDLLQERWYDENGFPKLDKDYGHDHGAGDPHIHEWSFPSPLAPKPVRGPGLPLN